MSAPPLTPARIAQLGQGFRETKALHSAVELGVFAALAQGPLDLAALRGQIGIHQRGARDFFDTLVALGLLERDANGCYANVPAAERYLVAGSPTYIGGLLDHVRVHEYPVWNFLTRALQTGEPQSPAGAVGLYPALYADPAALDTFIGGMSGGSALVAEALVAKFPWQGYRTLIDVGSAEGCVPVQIAQRHAHIVGGGFDLAPVAAKFENYVRAHGLSHRLQFYPGDFLADELPACDVLIMGRVLHNWDLPTKQMLLKKAHEALRGGGALIVYERFIDDARRESAAGLLASLNMLVMTAGGFDYSGADCIGWMREAGFKDMRIERLTLDQSMVVGIKPERGEAVDVGRADEKGKDVKSTSDSALLR
jgi:O-methyltransferase/methyltransferase family protein